MKSAIIPKVFMVMIFAISIISCKEETTKFKADFTSTLNSVDMIEFKKGDSSHRFVFPEDLQTIKKLLLPVELMESQSEVTEYSTQIILYKNSEVVGEVGVNDEAGLVYSLNTISMQAAQNDQLNAFIKDIQF